MPAITEEGTEQEPTAANENEEADASQAGATTDWHSQDNPYRGKRAIDSDKVFKVLLVVVLVGIAAVAAFLATRLLGHREASQQVEVEPVMQETSPVQEPSFDRPLLSKPQPEGQPIAVDAGDDGTTREFLSTVDVYEEIPVTKATGIQSEGAVISDLRGRGLATRTDTGTGVSAMYDMDGTYRRTWTETPVADNGKERHPTYATAYMSEATGILWSISSQNGKVLATPVLRAGEDDATDLGLPVEIVVSEDDTLMSYDSHGDRFWRLLPRDGGESLVAKVDRVDAATLDKIGIDELRGLMS